MPITPGQFPLCQLPPGQLPRGQLPPLAIPPRSVLPIQMQIPRGKLVKLSEL